MPWDLSGSERSNLLLLMKYWKEYMYGASGIYRCVKNRSKVSFSLFSVRRQLWFSHILYTIQKDLMKDSESWKLRNAATIEQWRIGNWRTGNHFMQCAQQAYHNKCDFFVESALQLFISRLQDFPICRLLVFQLSSYDVGSICNS